MLEQKAGRARFLVRAAMLLAAAPLIALAMAEAAHAQPVDRYLLDKYFPEGVPGYGTETGVTVRSRLRPDYDPPGVRAGSFMIRPQVSESLGYNDNVLGTTKGKGSFMANTQAQIAANSNWGRNSLGALITVDDRRLPSVSSQDRTDWTASLGGTYEFGRDQLALAATHISSHQDPTDLATFPFDKPLPFTLDNVHAAYTSLFGRFSLVPSFDYTRLRFSNGIVGGVQANQGFRNRDIFQGAVQLRYEFAPLRNAVVEARGVGTNYVNSSAGATLPGSTGIAVLAGLDYVVSGVWRYRALVGIEQRNFSNPANATTRFKSRTAPIAEGNVIWTPTELTTVTGRIVHTIEDPSDETTQGYDYTSARILVDHEYLRNILLRGYVGLQRADYVGVNFNQTLYQGGASVTWLVNRHARVTLSYDLTDRQGSKNVPTGTSFNGLPVSGGNYLQNIYLVQLRVQL